MQDYKGTFFNHSKLLVLTSILLLVIKVIISYEPFHDSLQYIQLGTNFIQNAKYHLDGYPNRFSPVVPFWYGLVFVNNNPSLTIILVGFISLIHFVLTMYFISKTFEILGIDNYKIGLVLVMFATNTHVFNWTGMLCPESFLGLYFWSFLYYIVKLDKQTEDWFLLGLTYSLLCIAKLVFIPLILVVAYIIVYDRLFPKYLSILSFCFGTLLLAFYVRYYYSVLLPDVSKLVDFDYGTRFNGSLKETLMKGIGLLPYKTGWNVDGLPSVINIFIPKTGLRSWWMSLLAISMLFFPFIIHNRENELINIKLLLGVLIVVLLSFVAAGTGFPRYWIPIYPIIFLIFLNALAEMLGKMKIRFNLTTPLLYVLVYAHLFNNFRIVLSNVK